MFVHGESKLFTNWKFYNAQRFEVLVFTLVIEKFAICFSLPIILLVFICFDGQKIGLFLFTLMIERISLYLLLFARIFSLSLDFSCSQSLQSVCCFCHCLCLSLAHIFNLCSHYSSISIHSFPVLIAHHLLSTFPKNHSSLPATPFPCNQSPSLACNLLT